MSTKKMNIFLSNADSTHIPEASKTAGEWPELRRQPLKNLFGF